MSADVASTPLDEKGGADAMLEGLERAQAAVDAIETSEAGETSAILGPRAQALLELRAQLYGKLRNVQAAVAEIQGESGRFDAYTKPGIVFRDLGPAFTRLGLALAWRDVEVREERFEVERTDTRTGVVTTETWVQATAIVGWELVDVATGFSITGSTAGGSRGKDATDVLHAQRQAKKYTLLDLAQVNVSRDPQPPPRVEGDPPLALSSEGEEEDDVRKEIAKHRDLKRRYARLAGTLRPWQEEALIEAHREVRDDPTVWNQREYEDMIRLLQAQAKVPRAIQAAGAKLAKTEPADPERIEHLQELMEELELPVRARAEIQPAIDCGWHDAVEEEISGLEARKREGS